MRDRYFFLRINAFFHTHHTRRTASVRAYYLISMENGSEDPRNYCHKIMKYDKRSYPHHPVHNISETFSLIPRHLEYPDAYMTKFAILFLIFFEVETS